MSDSVEPPVNQFTGAATVLRQCGRTSDWMVHAGLLEKDREQEPFPRVRSPGTSSVVPRIGCVWIVRLHLNRILLFLDGEDHEQDQRRFDARSPPTRG